MNFLQLAEAGWPDLSEDCRVPPAFLKSRKRNMSSLFPGSRERGELS